MRVKTFGIICPAIVILACLAYASAAIAGGGSENMLLVVNPNDPSSLEIANAYAALRDIPANNILFIAPPAGYQNDGSPISQAQATSTYLTPIANAISARGLSNQINYIGTIGQATCYSITPAADTPGTSANSLNYALDLLTPLTNGSGLTLQTAAFDYASNVPISALYQDPSNIPNGDNPAVVHSTAYNVSYSGTNIVTQYYMSGTIGYTGTNGNTVAQVIASLRNGVASDGTRPAGTIYFEDSGDANRSLPRQPEWAATEAQLTARGILWLSETGTAGNTPLNRNNVLGAVCGAQTLTLPNGSTYVPGVWADNLTSYGCDFADPQGQTLATAFIAAGASGTTGSVAEPYVPNSYPPAPPRFTNSSIYTFIADGSTFAEAFAKSVPAPDTQMPLGDMLAQPFADVPKVNLTAAPAGYGATVGNITVSASAGLVSPVIATGISSLELLVDGLASSANTLAGGSGTFHLNTASLSDGLHEIRIVGINNSQAASEGYTAEEVVVDNHGRSVSFNGGNLTLTSAAATIGLAATAGDGAISQVELTCLGRVVSQASGAAGSLSLSPTALAPGDNVIVPVAVYSDGMQVSGGAFVAHVESGPVNGWNNAAGTGLWSNPGNWSSGVTPQNGDGVARLSGATSGGTVTIDSSASVQEVDLDNSGGGYTIAAVPGQTLTLSTTNGVAAECLVNVLAGSHTISAGLVLAAPGNLVNVTNLADCLTISGNVGGSGALTKTGSGTLILLGSDSYSGATSIAAGTLQVGSGGGSGTLGSGPVANNSVLAWCRSGTVASANPISGVGSLIQAGPGTLTLAATNSYTGTTTISGGALQAADGIGLPSASTLLFNGGVLQTSGSFTRSIGTSGGGVEWTSQGGGFAANGGPLTVSLSSGGPLTWGTSASQLQGTLDFGSATADNETNFLNAINLNGATRTINVTAGAGGDYAQISGLLYNNSRSAGLIKTGNGRLVLAGNNNNYTGTTITAGTLQIGNGGASGSLGSGPVVDNATLVLDLASSSSITSSISGSGALVQAGSGVFSLGLLNSYSGGTTIAAGAVAISSSAGLGSGGLSFSGNGSGVLTIYGSTAFSSKMAVALNQNGAIQQNNSAGATLAGGISGPGELIKSGSGSLVLEGTNTYSGGTTVAGGTLYISNLTALPDASLTVLPGGTLILNVPSQDASPIVGEDSDITPTEAGGEGNGGSITAATAFQPPATAAGAPLNAVPEPDTLLLLLASGAGGLYWRLLRRRPRPKAKR